MVYYLKKYLPTKSNYKIHDKEFLVIIYCLEIWDAELRSIPQGFEIITDYKNIEYFTGKWYLNER